MTFTCAYCKETMGDFFYNSRQNCCVECGDNGDADRVNSLAEKVPLGDYIGDVLDLLYDARQNERNRCARELEAYALQHPEVSEDYQFVMMAARMLLGTTDTSGVAPEVK